MFFKGAYIKTIFRSQSFLYLWSFLGQSKSILNDHHIISVRPEPGNLTTPFFDTNLLLPTKGYELRNDQVRKTNANIIKNRNTFIQIKLNYSNLLL